MHVIIYSYSERVLHLFGDDQYSSCVRLEILYQINHRNNLYIFIILLTLMSNNDSNHSLCSGAILRDQHGVSQVRYVTSSKILRILKAKSLAPELPEDLYHLIKKAVAIRKHLERNRSVYRDLSMQVPSGVVNMPVPSGVVNMPVPSGVVTCQFPVAW